MPTYRIRHKETGEMFEGFMSISEKEEFMKENLEFEKKNWEKLEKKRSIF